MKSTAYISGFLAGLAIVVLIVLIRVFLKRRLGAGVCGNEYDERQKAIQGAGYKYAYTTMLITMTLGGIIENLFGVEWASLFSFAIIGMWLSICVFVTYCVIKDAYFSLRSRRKPLLVISLAAGLINLGIGLRNCIFDGGLIENGHLDLNFTSLFTGVCCLYLGVMMVVRTIYERRMEESE